MSTRSDEFRKRIRRWDRDVRARHSLTSHETLRAYRAILAHGGEITAYDHIRRSLALPVIKEIEEQRETSSFETRVSKLEKFAERQDFLSTVAIQPVLSRAAAALEISPESTEAPPASSARYELNVKLKELLDTTENLANDFQDLRDRLSRYAALQRQLGELLKLSRVRSNRILHSAILTIHDASYSVYSEDLSIHQVETLRDWIKGLRDLRTIDRDDVRALDKSLRVAGFETIPSDQFSFSTNG